MHALLATDQERIRAELPRWPRRVSGYSLDWLLPERGGDLARALVGTEGTCAVVAGATIALVRPPAAKCLLVLGFPDDLEGADAVPALLGADPLTVESLSAELLALAHVKREAIGLPHGGAWLMVEAGGDTMAAAHDHAARLAATIGRTFSAGDVELIDDTRGQAALWRIREDGAGHAGRLLDGGPAWPGFEDSAVPPQRLGRLPARASGAVARPGSRGRHLWPLRRGLHPSARGLRAGSAGRSGALRAVHERGRGPGGAARRPLSGEHGDGRARSGLLARMYSPEMIDLFGRFKALWDPAGVLNPGVIVRPPPVTVDLRSLRPVTLTTKADLAFAHDGGSFRSAADRCIGVGRCVSVQGSALMCPSFRATGDERHSTRGRARLLQELMTGELATEGWRSDAVLDALDLCLACKGCVSECPTSVDMASYKSEFLHHHYRRRLRPRSHYALGWLPIWLRLGERMPRVVNALTGGRLTRRAFALAAGIAAERSIPPLARRSFRRAYRASAPGPTGAAAPATDGRVVLWPDTFNDHLTPQVAHAAVAVLDAAGFEVVVPGRAVCCGLTWMTTGQLDTARRIRRGRWRLPSSPATSRSWSWSRPARPCCSTDMAELLPRDPRAASVAGRVRTLAELLDDVGFQLPDAMARAG